MLLLFLLNMFLYFGNKHILISDQKIVLSISHQTNNSIKKLAENLNTYLSQEDTQTAKGYIKRC